MKLFFEKKHENHGWNIRRHGLLIMLLTILPLVFAGCGERILSAQSVDTAMGTIISQTISVRTSQRQSDAMQPSPEELCQEVLAGIRTLETDMLSKRCPESEIARINSTAGTESGIILSQELKDRIEECLELSEASGGAFDITLGEVTNLWDIDTWSAMQDTSGYPIPDGQEVRKRLEKAGYTKVRLTEDEIMLPAGLQLDMGAVGKGIALDEIKAMLSSYPQVQGAVISVGGSILTYGVKEDGSPWNVAIINPHNTAEYIGSLQLQGEWCVSTSGDYERYVEADGVRYHHIIAPKTGYPSCSDVSSVTVLSKNGLESDALSTACFVLGSEQGLALAREMGAEALFVCKSGEIVMTEGMEQYFHLSNPSK